MGRQDTFREGGVDLVGIDAGRQLEGPLEGAVTALRDKAILLAFLLFLLFSPLIESRPLATFTSTSFASIPGISAVILYSLSDSITSTTGDICQAALSNDGMPNARMRSGKDRQPSGFKSSKIWSISRRRS
ncbi:hypothetical protein AU381_21905 [Sinorhizobium glycinis]|uniref:Uncharacterized protein n=1 Tax=Sinorhizobium glycinis TaxID=1472378 RepID=A0A178XSL8_9HYPH|nr:hypothetical protein AU381_21905 [Sinorhizobium glycinis]